MIAAWMLVSMLLGVVIALGALGLDAGARASQRPVRWTWMGALALVVILTVLVPFRRTNGAGGVRLDAVTITTAPATVHGGGAMPLLPSVVAAARAMLDAPVARITRSVQHVVSPAIDRWLLGVWLVCSLVLLVLGVTVLRRLLHARRTWPVTSLHGERVHVAPDAGPAVLGLVRGAIVVPCWLAECGDDVQRVVLALVREHVRARDPLLLALGAMSAVLLPWNPAVWWMLARLRLAVELDCDRRVIGAGVRTRDYGTLLIDLAGRTTGIPLGAPLVGLTMLAERTTHLERRIVAMSTPRPRHAALRVAAGSLVALASTLAACEAKMPTSVDVDNMTAASAERAAVRAHMLSADDSLRRYYIDGFLAGASDAATLKPGQIATVMVRRDTLDPSKGSVWITTRAGADSAVTLAAREARAGRVYHVTMRPGTSTAKVTRITADGRPFVGDTVTVHMSSSRFAGLIFIDGKRRDESAMKQINPADIQSIEVIKGARAAELYPNEPAAAQGIIQVTTKQGAH